MTPTTPTLFPPELGRVAIKICGITSGGQAESIVAAGADAIGINFWPRSKRYISLEAAMPWLRQLAGQVPRVAVLVNPEDDDMKRLMDSGVIDWLQLHGDETPDRVRSVTQQGWPVFKALGVRDSGSLEQAATFPGRTLLLDAYAPVEYGGSGHTMDWSLGATAVKAWPERQVILAGGLTPENLSEAIIQVRPAAVDVASGVESSPGLKDLEKVRAFIEAAQSVR